MTLLRYKQIDDPFAGLPNKALKGMLVESSRMKGIKKLFSAHSYLFRSMSQLYDEQGGKIADRADIEALNLLMTIAGVLVADTAMDAICQS
jgi:hypothetical protein